MQSSGMLRPSALIRRRARAGFMDTDKARYL